MTTHNSRQSLDMNNRLLVQLSLAGAAALAGSGANAQLVYVPVNENVGVAMGELPSFTTTLPSTHQITIKAHHHSGKTNSILIGDSNHAANDHAYLKDTEVAGLSNAPVLAAAGQTFNNLGGALETAGDFAVVKKLNSTHEGYTPFTNKYLDFKFTNSSTNQVDYGYIDVSLTNNTFNGIDLDILYYVYNTSGAEVPAGVIPEPSSSLALAALSALTLGAVGVRRLKALKAAI